MTSGLTSILDQYNNGLAPDGPPNCDDSLKLAPTALPELVQSQAALPAPSPLSAPAPVENELAK